MCILCLLCAVLLWDGEVDVVALVGLKPLNSLCVLVLRSPILALLLHGTRMGISQTLRRWAEGATCIRQGTLGIGPHSNSLIWMHCIVACSTMSSHLSFQNANKFWSYWYGKVASWTRRTKSECCLLFLQLLSVICLKKNYRLIFNSHFPCELGSAGFLFVFYSIDFLWARCPSCHPMNCVKTLLHGT